MFFFSLFTGKNFACKSFSNCSAGLESSRILLIRANIIVSEHLYSLNVLFQFTHVTFREKACW